MAPRVYFLIGGVVKYETFSLRQHLISRTWMCNQGAHQLEFEKEPEILVFLYITKTRLYIQNIQKISPPKTENFQIKILMFFIFLLKT